MLDDKFKRTLKELVDTQDRQAEQEKARKAAEAEVLRRFWDESKTHLQAVVAPLLEEVAAYLRENSRPAGVTNREGVPLSLDLHGKVGFGPPMGSLIFQAAGESQTIVVSRTLRGERYQTHQFTPTELDASRIEELVAEFLRVAGK